MLAKGYGVRALGKPERVVEHTLFAIGSCTKQFGSATVAMLVQDKKLLQELMKLSAGEWFEKRHQFELDYPKETELNAGRWEWVPGQDVKVDRVPVSMDIVGGVVFANYFNAGTHRAPIDPRKGILITLGDENLCVQSLKEPAKPCAPARQSGR